REVRLRDHWDTPAPEGDERPSAGGEARPGRTTADPTAAPCNDFGCKAGLALDTFLSPTPPYPTGGRLTRPAGRRPAPARCGSGSPSPARRRRWRSRGSA